MCPLCGSEAAFVLSDLAVNRSKVRLLRWAVEPSLNLDPLAKKGIQRQIALLLERHSSFLIPR
jgi:hypothetical protein